jgi:hypothetical protein
MKRHSKKKSKRRSKGSRTVGRTYRAATWCTTTHHRSIMPRRSKPRQNSKTSRRTSAKRRSSSRKRRASGGGRRATVSRDMRDTLLYRSGSTPATPRDNASSPPSTPKAISGESPDHESPGWEDAAIVAVCKSLNKTPVKWPEKRPNSQSIVIMFESHVYKVFKQHPEYQQELQGYESVKEKAPHIIPEFETQQVAGYHTIILPRLEAIKIPSSAEGKAKLKIELTNVLQQLWEKGLAHGDVIIGEFIHLANFMNNKGKIVLIDLELQNINATDEKERWESANFYTESATIVEEQREALQSLRSGWLE